MIVTIGEINRQLKSALNLGKANLRKKGVEVADDATIYGIMGAIERIPLYSSANNRGYGVSVQLQDFIDYQVNAETSLIKNNATISWKVVEE